MASQPRVANRPAAARTLCSKNEERSRATPLLLSRPLRGERSGEGPRRLAAAAAQHTRDLLNRITPPVQLAARVSYTCLTNRERGRCRAAPVQLAARAGSPIPVWPIARPLTRPLPVRTERGKAIRLPNLSVPGCSCSASKNSARRSHDLRDRIASSDSYPQPRCPLQL